jgi:hypothetical protein
VAQTASNETTTPEEMASHMIEFVAQAAARGARVVVFPEMAVRIKHGCTMHKVTTDTHMHGGIQQPCGPVVWPSDMTSHVASRVAQLYDQPCGQLCGRPCGY